MQGVLCYNTGLAAASVKGFGLWVLGVLGRLWGGFGICVWWVVFARKCGVSYRVLGERGWSTLRMLIGGFAALIEQSAFRGMVCHSAFYWLLVGNGLASFFARYMFERRYALW